MQPRPSGPITTQSKNSLQAQCAGAILLAGHKPHRPEPGGERLPRVLEHRASRHRSLKVAVRTLEQSGSNRPRLAPSATRTPKPLRPPQSKEVLATAFFGRKPSLELLKSPRVIFHSATILPVGAT